MIHIVGLVFKIIGIALLALLAILLLYVLIVLCIPSQYHGFVHVQEETAAKLVVNGPLWLYRLRMELKDGGAEYQFRILGIPVFKSGGKERVKEKDKKKKSKKKPEGFFEKIKYTFQNFCVKIKETWNNSKELKALLQKDVTKEAFSDLKKEAAVILRQLRPKKLEGYVEFGTGDPASTGQLLGVISIFYFAIPNRIALYPSFDEKRFHTELSVKGRLRFLKLLGCVFRLYGNRKINYVYKKIMNLGGNKHVRKE